MHTVYNSQTFRKYFAYGFKSIFTFLYWARTKFTKEKMYSKSLTKGKKINDRYFEPVCR